jgi:1-acyl-sn-glycerol-3-phosphate acyltransferase
VKKWSLRYELFRRVLSFAFSRFYRHVEVYGRQHIPHSGPVIFCENHAKAVIDPVSIAAMQPRQPGFLARSDVFSNKMLAGLFRTFKMLPIYRQRDKVNTITANQPIFDAVVTHLSVGGSFIIAPEGDKGIDHHLLPLKKGVSRIAVQYMNKHGWHTNLSIIPVGITYSGYSSWGHDLSLRFGKPVYVKDFRESYAQDPSRIFKIITAHLADKIKPLIWHEEERSWLPWLYELKRLDGVRPTLMQRMNWCSAILHKLRQADESKLQALQRKLHPYLKTLEEKRLTDLAVATAATSNRIGTLLLTVLLAHFALLHKLFHFLPQQLAAWLVRKLNPHPHFHASILFGLLLATMPVFYFMYFSLAWAVSGLWWAGALLMIVLPLLASPSRWWFRCWQRTKVPESLKKQRKDLMEALDAIA